MLPIAGFLERNPDGGLRRLCYEVSGIRTAHDALKAAGMRGGGGGPKIPTLVELEQA